MKSKRLLPFFLIFLLCFGICHLPAQEFVKQEEKISLDLKNIEVVELLRILSLKTGKTIVPSRDVTGRITVFLNNVALKDILDIIVLTQGYALEQRGDIYYIMSNADYKTFYGRDYIELRKLKTIRLNYAKPANVFNALSQLKSDTGKIIADEASGTLILIDIPEKLELMEKTAKELDRSLETVVYDLNYAKPADARIQLNAAITPGTGQVIVDERSGKAIVSDLPAKMEKIDRLVKELDEETRQVFIETEIVEVTLTNEFQRGINWEQVSSNRSVAGLDLVGSYPMALSTFQKIAVGVIAQNKFNIILNFLQTYGNTKIISQPRIAVVNNEEASIMVGTREAYVTQTLSQAETTTVTSENIEFIDVGVKLKIVPTINKEGFINMKIKPEVSTVKEIITTSLGSRIPIVQTSQAETVVKVKNGTMIMIAGLIKETTRDTITGIPWASRIPLIGSFFGNRDKYNQKTEMIIFITPHLTRGDSVLPGYEPEKIIPPEVMPDNVKRKLVREEVMIKSLLEGTPKITQTQEEKLQAEVKKLDAVTNLQETERIEKEKKAKELQKSEEAKKLKAKKSEQVQKKEEAKKLEEAKKSEETKKPEQVKKPIEVRAPDMLKAAELYQKGMELQKQGKLNEAKDSFEKSADADPKFAFAYNQLGIILETEGLSDQAENMYLKAAELDPKCSAAYSNLALLNEAKGDNAKAIKYWRKRAELGDSKDPWTKEALRHIEELKKGD